MTKSRTAFDLVLAVDVETSGLALGCENPVYNPATQEKFQTLSLGMVVASVTTLRPIDELYVEIKFDSSKYTWSEGAERVHGMSREYLEQNGMELSDAVAHIITFIEKYFGPIDLLKRLTLLGHNVATFDRHFLYDLFASAGVEIQFGNRHIDTFTLGVVLLDLFSSNELFDFFELPRDPENHNALQDTKHALTCTRLIRKFFKSVA
jgi:DNA polymerase III epsilon subunit-like protein